MCSSGHLIGHQRNDYQAANNINFCMLQNVIGQCVSSWWIAEAYEVVSIFQIVTVTHVILQSESSSLKIISKPDDMSNRAPEGTKFTAIHRNRMCISVSDHCAHWYHVPSTKYVHISSLRASWLSLNIPWVTMLKAHTMTFHDSKRPFLIGYSMVRHGQIFPRPTTLL